MRADQVEVRRFVRDALTRGAAPEDIAAALRGAGWSATETATALMAFDSGPMEIPVPRPSRGSAAFEALQYLLLFVALYASAIAIGIIAFDAINDYFPDPADRYTFWSGGSRRATATLIVFVPVYLAMSWWIRRSIEGDPGRLRSGVRLWLTYVAILITTVVMLNEISALTFGFISGELTIGIGLKSVVVLALAIPIIAYYAWDLHSPMGVR